MDLLEYQGKQLFARHGLPVPDGRAVTTVDDAVAAANEIGYPVVVKAQVLIGGRGKAGGVKLAANEDEAREHATHILGMDIRGHTVHEVWIEERLGHRGRVLRLDPASTARPRQPLMMFSQARAASTSRRSPRRTPEAIATLHVDPLLGFQDFHGRRLAFEGGVDADLVRPIGALPRRLYEVRRRRRRRSPRSTR